MSFLVPGAKIIRPKIRKEFYITIRVKFKKGPNSGNQGPGCYLVNTILGQSTPEYILHIDIIY